MAAGFRPQRFSADGASPERYGLAGSHARDRGRLADAPSQIPARGWKDILLRVYRNMGEDRVIALAAGVTFYSVLALFPAIAALVALYGLFADPASIAEHVNQLSGIVPGGGITVIGDEMKRIAAQGNNTLGITFIT
jgi:membrane protein